MIYLNATIIVFVLILAILSRKHYSKYKDGTGVKAWVVAVGLSMGYCVWIFLNNVVSLEGLKNRLAQMLRRNQIVSHKRLELITDRFIAKNFAISLGLITLFCIFELGSFIYNKYFWDEKNIIEREEFGGDVQEEEICYELSGQEQSIMLSVSPVRLSQEEFYSKADEVALEIEKEYFEQGTIASQAIELPLSDREGVFDISWISHKPHILSSRGRVKAENLKETVEVSLTMYISYYDYCAEYVFTVLVGGEERSEEQIIVDDLEQALNNLEQETIEDKEILIPEEINDVKISVRNNRGSSGRFLILGFIFAVVTIGISISRLKESVDKRDRQLMREYPYFVDNLWLYIESGMNIKRGLQEYVNTKNKEEIFSQKEVFGNRILIDEIKYTINQIKNGEVEYVAYEELGARLGVPVYVSLMRHISQNLKMGTKDLRVLMEAEVTMALETKKESAKRLGEEASTKLVFPMIILLVVVMMLIMTPAFMGF